MWPRKVTLRSWCDCVHSRYGVDSIPQSHSKWFLCTQCTLYSGIHLADFMFLLYIAQSRQSSMLFLQSSELGLPRPFNRRRVCPPLLWVRGRGTLACGLMWPRKVTLRSQKISIKWLWPVKVTLKVIKRRLKVFCWSCDEIPLKWEEKKFPSLQLWIGIEWDYSWPPSEMIGQCL